MQSPRLQGGGERRGAEGEEGEEEEEEEEEEVFQDPIPVGILTFVIVRSRSAFKPSTFGTKDEFHTSKFAE